MSAVTDAVLRPVACAICPHGQGNSPVQQVEWLEVGWVDPDAVRDGLAEVDRLRAVVALSAVEPGQQLHPPA